MAKGQHFSSYQKKVVNRYYEHLDTATLQKLSEIVTDLFLAEADGGGAKAAKLWEKAAAALVKTNVDPTQLGETLKSRDIKKLAALVNDLSGKKNVLRTHEPGGAPSGSSTGSASPTAPPASTASSSTPPDAAPAAASASPEGGSDNAPPADEVTKDQKKQAMRAFRKRIKLLRLEDESKLGRSPLSSGRASGIDAIQPPRQYRLAVWEALVKDGRLKPAGPGFYQLAEEA